MKAKATVNAKSKAGKPAKVTEVSAAAIKASTTAALVAAAKGVFEAHVGVQHAIKVQEQSWVKCADVLSKLCAFKADGQAALKLVFEQAKRTDLYAGQIRSKIAALAYPEAPEQLAKAKAAGKGQNDLVAVARGSKAFNKKGELVTVAKDTRGGGNKKSPLETFKLAIGNAGTAAKLAKIALEVQAIAQVEAMKANGYKLDDIQEAFEAALKD